MTLRRKINLLLRRNEAVLSDLEIRANEAERTANDLAALYLETASERDDLRAELDTANEDVATMYAEVQALRVERDRLEAELTECQAPVNNLLYGMTYMAGENPLPFEARVDATIELRRFFVPSQRVAPAVRAVHEDIIAGRKATQISFKLGFSWQEAATGAIDAWARDAAASLAAAAHGTDHIIQVAIQHEPENDTGANDGSTVAGRDAWVAMQARLGPIFRAAGLQYGVILMGWHSVPAGGGNTRLWLLEKWLPALGGAIDFVGINPYDVSFDVKSFATQYAAYIDAQTKAIGATWGLSESGITATAFSTRPTWFEDLAKVLVAHNATFYAYFNTGLNNVGGSWVLGPGDARERAFVDVLKSH